MKIRFMCNTASIAWTLLSLIIHQISGVKGSATLSDGDKVELALYINDWVPGGNIFLRNDGPLYFKLQLDGIAQFTWKGNQLVSASNKRNVGTGFNNRLTTHVNAGQIKWKQEYLSGSAPGIFLSPASGNLYQYNDFYNERYADDQVYYTPDSIPAGSYPAFIKAIKLS